MLCELDWTAIPGGVGVYSTHSTEEADVPCGFRLGNGKEYVVVMHQELIKSLAKDGFPYDGTVYSRYSPDEPFRWDYLGQGASWLEDARRDLVPGEHRKVRNKRVTRMSEDELAALEPLQLSSGSA